MLCAGEYLWQACRENSQCPDYTAASAEYLDLITMIRSRIAPTPSGYLHIGNALNFVLTYTMVHRASGTLRLRIDDIDAPRARPEYIADIFQTLEWLGVEWQQGPHTPAEHHTSFSQALRASRYTQCIDLLIATGLTYSCTCSRRELQACQCRSMHIPLDAPDAALRIAAPSGPITITDQKLGILHISLRDQMGDFVIRRRDGIAAYQVASLADDIDHGTTLIVRGEDLLPSTAAQLYLASLIGADSFIQTSFYHHPLLTDTTGSKLSKSAGSTALHTMRAGGMTRGEFYTRLSRILNVAPAQTLTELSEQIIL